MTKRILCLLLVCLAVITACAEEAGETLLEKALRISEDHEQLITLDEEELTDVVGIDPEYYTDYAYLAGKDTSSGRELIVLRAKDITAAKTVAETLEEYRGQRLRCTRNYYPEAYRALSESEVMQEDLLIVLSIGAPDPKEPDLLLREE